MLPKTSPFGPLRPARVRSSHATPCINPDFGASEAAPGTLRGCYIVLQGSTEIDVFARSKNVRKLRPKNAPRYTNAAQIGVPKAPQNGPPGRIHPPRLHRDRCFCAFENRSKITSKKRTPVYQCRAKGRSEGAAKRTARPGFSHVRAIALPSRAQTPLRTPRDGARRHALQHPPPPMPTPAPRFRHVRAIALPACPGHCAS